MTRQRGTTKRQRAGTRAYELGKRGESMEETRRRIAEAAIALHGTVGPAYTSMSAVADQAGVTRMTLYRHFPSEQELFGACSSLWRDHHPWPDPASWVASTPRRRVLHALGDLYPFYAENAAMLGNLIRDADAVPAELRDALAAGPFTMADALLDAWPRTRRTKELRATLVHVCTFTTWLSLSNAGLETSRCESTAVVWVMASAPGR